MREIYIDKKVVIGVLVALAVIILFFILRAILPQNTNPQSQTDTNVAENNDDDNNNDKDGGSILNGSNTDSKTDNGSNVAGAVTGDSGLTKEAESKSNSNQQKINETGRWSATNYAKGDITVKEYKVRKGDTLWEIAEAYYGSGFKWKEILAKNKAKIGFLKNGTQALIRPGTVLEL